MRPTTSRNWLSMKQRIYRVAVAFLCMIACVELRGSDASQSASDREASQCWFKWGGVNLLPMFLGSAGTAILAWLTYWLKCSNDAKNAFRVALLPYMSEISSDMDGVLAQCHVYLAKCKELQDKGKGGENPETKESLQRCLSRISCHVDKLRLARKSVRYFLWDEDDVADRALRKIEKIGGWVTQFRSRGKDGLEMLDKANELRKSIDRMLINAYRRGNSPDWRRISDVDRKMRAAGAAFQQGDDVDDVIVAGVDFVVPESILCEYRAKVGCNDGGPISGAKRTEIYSLMLKALAEKAI